MRDRRPPQKFAKNPVKNATFLEIWPKIAKNPVKKGGGTYCATGVLKKIGLKKGGDLVGGGDLG